MLVVVGLLTVLFHHIPLSRGQDEGLPEPRVMIKDQTGSDKSTLALPIRTIEDVLNENEKLKSEVKRLNDHNITELYNMIIDLTATQKHDIDKLTTEVKTLIVDHKEDVNRLDADIKNVTKLITDLTSAHNMDVEELGTEIKQVNDGMALQISVLTNTLRDEIDSVRYDVVQVNISSAPFGSITAWSPIPNKDSSHPVDLPSGWVKCDGQTIQEGIWKGQKTPEINGPGYFLRGSKDNVLSTQEDQVSSLKYEDWMYSPFACPSGWNKVGKSTGGVCEGCNPDPVCMKAKDVSGTSGSETRPKNVKVFYIMKIK